MGKKGVLFLQALKWVSFFYDGKQRECKCNNPHASVQLIQGLHSTRTSKNS